MSAPERRDPQDAVFAPEELLRALPTPCYVYDEAQLRTRAARLRSAFSWSAGFRAWFPVRALPNPTVLRILREEGQGALCVTAGEYRLALASGFSPESIRFAPEFPTDAELAVPAADLVLDDGGLLLRLERERPLPARLGLRLRPEPDRSFHKAEATRFGMRTGELLDTAQELRLKGVREVGLSAMLGLGLRDPEAFSALARALFTCAAALHDSFGLQVSYCCLGGGLPVAHRRTERDADIAAVSRGVQAEFSRIMEPSGLGGVPVETGLGRWLTAHAGILLTTVTGVKRGAQDWLGVDASRADLLRPELAGKIAFADPSVSGSSYTALVTMLCALPGETDEILQAFAENLDGKQLQSSGAVLTAVAGGQAVVGVTLEETASRSIAAGDELVMVYPADGTSCVPDGCAILKGAPHEENAKLFVDFTVSLSVQKLLQERFCRRSVRGDLESTGTLPALSQIPQVDYDVGWASRSREALLMSWEFYLGTEAGA